MENVHSSMPFLTQLTAVSAEPTYDRKKKSWKWLVGTQKEVLAKRKRAKKKILQKPIRQYKEISNIPSQDEDKQAAKNQQTSKMKRKAA